MVQITARDTKRWAPLSRKRLIRNSSFIGLGIGFCLFVISGTKNIENYVHYQHDNVLVSTIAETPRHQHEYHHEHEQSMFMKDLATVQADDLWKDLLLEAEYLSKEMKTINTSPVPVQLPVLHVMEVGMHSADQCLEAATRNLHAHCVEPSPSSLGRINKKINRRGYDINKNVRFYQMAASGTSALELEFTSEGGTGDHVGGGGIDMWTMTKTKTQTKDVGGTSSKNTVIVKSVALDDIIDNKVEPTIDYALMKKDDNSDAVKSRPVQDKIDKLFLLKVDTQGHEPSVFSGLKKSIQEHKIDFIMTEYWPKGIDFMNDTMGRDTECKKSVEIMKLMYDAGYTLYTMSVTSHPKAPWNNAKWVVIRHNQLGKIEIPIHDLMAHCMWFYDLERDPKYADHHLSAEYYKMGYWTDVLAVAPNARLGKVPVSENGKIIAKHLSSL